MQKKLNVPAFVNVCRNVLPGLMRPESKLLLVAVTVCGSGSLFVHSTVVPTVTCSRGWRCAF